MSRPLIQTQYLRPNQEERGTPPSLKRGVPPATNKIYPVTSTVPKAFWSGQIGLKDRLKKKTFFRGKEIGAINLVKALIGTTSFYHLIEGEGARHLNLSSLKRGLGQFVGEKVSKRTILLQDRRPSSALLGVNLSPSKPYFFCYS